MSATITLPADLEQMATAKAAALGIDLQQFIEDAVRRAAELPDPWELFADVREHIAAEGITEEELEAEIDAAVQEVRTRHRAP